MKSSILDKLSQIPEDHTAALGTHAVPTAWKVFSLDLLVLRSNVQAPKLNAE